MLQWKLEPRTAAWESLQLLCLGLGNLGRLLCMRVTDPESCHSSLDWGAAPGCWRGELRAQEAKEKALPGGKALHTYPKRCQVVDSLPGFVLCYQDQAWEMFMCHPCPDQAGGAGLGGNCLLILEPVSKRWLEGDFFLLCQHCSAANLGSSQLLPLLSAHLH